VHLCLDSLTYFGCQQELTVIVGQTTYDAGQDIALKLVEVRGQRLERGPAMGTPKSDVAFVVCGDTDGNAVGQVISVTIEV